jgi:hypothetical protein
MLLFAAWQAAFAVMLKGKKPVVQKIINLVFGKEPTMKTLFVLSIILTCVWLTDCLAQTEPQPSQCVLCLIVDLSPASQWQQLQTAAENVYKYWSKSGSIGDTLLVYTVKGTTARLCFSCIKASEDGRFDDFSSVLRDVNPDWFVSSSLSAAIQGPIYNKIKQHAGQEGHAVIIALTEGNLSRQQASEICEFADNVKATHGWPLLLASSPDKTNRQLLIAAGKGRLHWFKLIDAADRALMEKLIQKIRSSVPIIVEKATSAQPTVTTDKKVTASEKEISAKPETAGKPPLKVQETRTAARPSDNATKPPAGPAATTPTVKQVSEKKTTEPNKPAEPNAFKPRPSVTGLKARAGSPVEIAHAKPSKEPKLPASSVAELARQKLAAADKSSLVDTLPASAVSGERQVKSASSDAVQKTKTLVKPDWKASHPLRSSPFSSLTTRLLAVGGVSVICIAVFLLLSSWLSARSWQKSAQNPVLDAQRQQENQPKILMARVGNSSYHLGNLSRFTAVHIGSSPENAIRINNKSVAPQHVEIYRRGDKLFARNLSKTEIVANGQKVRPRKRCPLTLPALVSIDQDVGVNLFFAKAAGSKSRNLQESENARAQNQ